MALATPRPAGLCYEAGVLFNLPPTSSEPTSPSRVQRVVKISSAAGSRLVLETYAPVCALSAVLPGAAIDRWEWWLRRAVPEVDGETCRPTGLLTAAHTGAYVSSMVGYPRYESRALRRGDAAQNSVGFLESQLATVAIDAAGVAALSCLATGCAAANPDSTTRIAAAAAGCPGEHIELSSRLELIDALRARGPVAAIVSALTRLEFGSHCLLWARRAWVAAGSGSTPWTGTFLECIELPRLGLSFRVELAEDARTVRLASLDHAGFAVASDLSRRHAALLSGFPLGLPLVGGPSGISVLILSPSYPCERTSIATAPLSSALVPGLLPPHPRGRVSDDLPVRFSKRAAPARPSPVAWAFAVHSSGFFVSLPSSSSGAVPAVLTAVHLLLQRRYSAAAEALRLVPIHERLAPAVLDAIVAIRTASLPSNRLDMHPDGVGVQLKMIAAAVVAFGVRDSSVWASMSREDNIMSSERSETSMPPPLFAALSLGDGDPRGWSSTALEIFAGSWRAVAPTLYRAYLGVLAHVSPACRLTEAEEGIMVALAAVKGQVKRVRELESSAKDPGPIAPYESAAASALEPVIRVRDAFLAGLQAAAEGKRVAVLLPTPPRRGVGCALGVLRRDAWSADGGTPRASLLASSLQGSLSESATLEVAEVLEPGSCLMQEGAPALAALQASSRFYVWPRGLPRALGRSAQELPEQPALLSVPFMAAYAVLCGDVRRTVCSSGAAAGAPDHAGNVAVGFLVVPDTGDAEAADTYERYASAISLADPASPRKRALLHAATHLRRFLQHELASEICGLKASPISNAW